MSSTITETFVVLKKPHKRKSSKRKSRRSPTSCPGPNNLPPLQFHSVHGDNIRISRDGTLAKRYESFCRAITFSARPVRLNERVCVKLTEVSNNWNGGIRFGFTSNDPATLESSLPKYACPDLTNRPGFWAKALHEQYCEKDNVLFYYVNSSGDVIYGINGDEKGVILSGIDTRGLLWTIIDVYGNCTGIEFLDARVYMYQQPSSGGSGNTGHQILRQQRSNLSENEMNRIMPSMQSLNLNDDINNLIPPVRYNASGRLIPVSFHNTKGRNVRLSQDRFVASRTQADFCQGYVFTARPLRIGEKIIIQILQTENMYVGALALGLTSCNPANLQPSDLPDDSDFLLDRPEYWVVSKDIASQPQRGDEISFYISQTGEVAITKNDGPPVIVMHVDQSLQLWAFLDIYGSTQSVRVFRQPLLTNVAVSQPQLLPTTTILSQQQQISQSHSSLQHLHNAQQITQVPVSTRNLQVNLPCSESINSLNSQLSESRKLAHLTTTGGVIPATAVANAAPTATNVSCTPLNVLPGSQSNQVQPIQTAVAQSSSNSRMISLPSNGDMIQIQPGGTVLVVNLPPAEAHITSSNSQTRLNGNITANVPSSSLAAAGITNGCGGSSQFIEPITTLKCSEITSQPQWKDKNVPAEQQNSGAECTICYENPIDSVLYMCGHMCMCYECAIEQWRGVGGGHCPLCRAMIRDVIRTYTT
ncbi:protein neuralized isoform X2 [Condylostylus longicornis]|uniref:protein neuralized isoform X2 n=1 Tax=Condylostylus longicornis TaxID=2530218 RepID=UPI00244DE93E|nr:protein neuralized isoform X2 [Condylostylus longicornis]